MRRLGYPDRLVEVRGGFVYVFKGKLYWAPLDQVVRAAFSRDVPLPRPLKEVAPSVASLLDRPIVEPSGAAGASVQAY